MVSSDPGNITVIGTDGNIFTPAAMSDAFTQWRYGGDVAGVNPGVGNIAIQGTGSNPRIIAASKTDATGVVRNWALLQPGDDVTITDDPTTPPITGFARYVVTSTPLDNGAWVSFQALRTDTEGSQTSPPIGTPLRVYTSANGGVDTRGFTFAQDTVPTATRVGDTWFDTGSGRSFVWFDSRWVMFAPGESPPSAVEDTGMRVIASWTAGVQNAADQIGGFASQITPIGTGRLVLRRYGAMVSIWFADNGASVSVGTTGTTNLFNGNPITSGIRMPFRSAIPMVTTLGAALHIDSGLAVTNWRVRTGVAAGNLNLATATWMTSDPFPDVLPGVPM